MTQLLCTSGQQPSHILLTNILFFLTERPEKEVPAHPRTARDSDTAAWVSAGLEDCEEEVAEADAADERAERTSVKVLTAFKIVSFSTCVGFSFPRHICGADGRGEEAWQQQPTYRPFPFLFGTDFLEHAPVQFGSTLHNKQAAQKGARLRNILGT